jgi:fumarate reductase iron-sulfur subunit
MVLAWALAARRPVDAWFSMSSNIAAHNEGAQMTPDQELEVDIWRGAEDGRFQRFRVPHRENQTVLDVVTWVQRHLEPALAYRFACRVGMCGSCAMTVNERARWTCRTHVSKVARDGALTIAPLRSLPKIKDLVADMSDFFEKWQEAGGRHRATASRRDPPAPVSLDSTPRRAAPAALNRAWTIVNDERHGERQATLAAVSAAGGCHACHTHGSCAEHCPVGLNPTLAIAGLKRVTLPKWLGGWQT